MLRIDSSLTAFSQAIQEGKSVSVTDRGEWKIQGRLISFFVRLLKLDARRELKIGKIYCQVLDKLEKIPVAFNTGYSQDVPPQKVDFQQYIQVAKVISKKLKESQSKEAKAARADLKRRIVALKYRLEEDNGGCNKLKAYDVLTQKELGYQQEIIALATVWKSKQFVIDEKQLTNVDLKKLKSAAHYPEFAKLLVQNSRLQDEFFKWILRDPNSVKAFVEFPAIQEKIKNCHLSTRIKRMGKKALQVIRQPVIGKHYSVKQVTLPFVVGKGAEENVIRVNILNGKNVVHFTDGVKISMKKIFQIFAHKRDKQEPGDLEAMEKGITLWNFKYGRWTGHTKLVGKEQVKEYEVADFSKANWWEQLPTFETITKEEAQKRYGSHMDGINWNVEAKASREKNNLDFEGNHGWMEVAIPRDDGHYVVYPFGRFPAYVPTSKFKRMGILANTVEAKIGYPDENVYYGHRQKRGVSFDFTPEQGQQLMGFIKEDMIKSQNRNLYFQFQGDNCAKWAQTNLEKVLGKENVPCLYRMKVLDATPSNPLLRVFYRIIRRSPKALQPTGLRIVNILFAPWRKFEVIDESGTRVSKSIMNNLFWKDLEIFHPAALPMRLDNGALRTRYSVAPSA